MMKPRRFRLTPVAAAVLAISTHALAQQTAPAEKAEKGEKREKK